MMLLNGDGKSNFHTHTLYCDGINTPAEMVEKAVELGFTALGFSGHKYSPGDEEWVMSLENEVKYRQEVLALKEAYKDKIKIYLGIERDYYSPDSDFEYDYVIGSVHSLKYDNLNISFDESEESMVRSVEKYFGGNYRKYVESYYELEADVVNKTKCNIVGHFDLVTKFNQGGKYFDTGALWYKRAAIKALAKVAESHPIFEINTGAMAKNYRKEAYPENFLVDEINRLGCTMILSSDCHNKDFLNFGFDLYKKEL